MFETDINTKESLSLRNDEKNIFKGDEDTIKLKSLGMICLVIFIILSIPIPMRLKDGGSVVYKGLYYKITDVHTLVEEPGKGYEDGIIIEIFGNEVYKNVK